MSPEMVSAWALNEVSFPSQMCIDAYGLELVAMHLLGSICQSRPGNVNKFCDEARKFATIGDRIEYKYNHEKDRHKAFNDGIRERSEAVQRIRQRLGVATDKQPLDRLMMRQISMVNVLSVHLIRVPMNSLHNDIIWIRSVPSQCMTWNEWRSAVESI